MSEQIVLVDFENVQPTLAELVKVAPGFTDLWLFHGPHQAKQAQQKNRPAIAALCSRFGVQTLEVFGSAAEGSFDPSLSDIDFLVEFRRDHGGSLFRRCFGLLEALEQLFQRKIQLMSAGAASNSDFLASVTTMAWISGRGVKYSPTPLLVSVAFFSSRPS